MSRLASIASSTVLAVILWQLAAALVDSTLFPSPLRVGVSLPGILLDLEVHRHLLMSIAIVAAGYLLSLGLALPLALACSRKPTVSAVALPAHEFIRYIPVPAFVPLCAAILGVGDSTKVALIFIGTYFQVLFLLIGDFASVPREFEDTARTLGMSAIRLVRHVIIPASLPHLIATGRITFAWAWSYLLVAEVVNARYGIGYLILQAYRVLNMPRLMALLVLVGLFGIVADSAFRILLRVLCPWYQRGQAAAT